MRRRVLVVPLLLLSACTTPEYDAERRACTAQWMTRIQPDFAQQLVERLRYEQRPTGRTTCTTTGNQTTCVDQMTTIAIPYTTVETVDLNKPRRDAQIADCTARACVARYGNPSCEGAV